MSVESSIYSFLTGTTAITNLVGSDIYPIHLPQSAGYPALTYTLVSAPRDHILSGAAGIARARIQFDCWSDTLSDCVSVMEALRISLQGYRGSLGSITVISNVLNNEIDLSEAPQDGSDTWTYRKSVDYVIAYRETIPAF